MALICPFTACCGSPSAPSWQAPRACKRRKASSVTRHGRHRTSPALHVTRKTRSRRLAVAPLHHGASRCTMEHHDATGVTTPRQTVKASPHRHKWMLSHGAPADPSDPWNSHAAPVSPRQNGQSDAAIGLPVSNPLTVAKVSRAVAHVANIVRFTVGCSCEILERFKLPRSGLELGSFLESRKLSFRYP